MKPKRNWTTKEKSMIIIEGLKGRPVVDICNDYGLSQTLYYKRKDKFLSNMGSVSDNSKEARLLRKNNKLKQCLAEATLELKKMEEGW